MMGLFLFERSIHQKLNIVARKDCGEVLPRQGLTRKPLSFPVFHTGYNSSKQKIKASKETLIEPHKSTVKITYRDFPPRRTTSVTQNQDSTTPNQCLHPSTISRGLGGR